MAARETKCSTLRTNWAGQAALTQYQATSPSNMFHRLTTGGTVAGGGIVFFHARAQIHDGADHVGNDLPGTFHQDPVTGADVFFSDVIEIVQSGIPDNDAVYLDRLEHGLGGQNPGPTQPRPRSPIIL